jgi:hypothetical protein
MLIQVQVEDQNLKKCRVGTGTVGNTEKAVLEIRETLVRIRIRGSVPLD